MKRQIALVVIFVQMFGSVAPIQDIGRIWSS
jgi:hypothetical protein